MEQQSGRIKFGIICSGIDLKAWQKETVLKLVSAPDIALELILIDQNLTPNQNASSSFLWKLFFNYRILRKSTMLQTTKINDLLKGVSKVQCNLAPSAGNQPSLSSEIIAQLKKKELDFIIDFSMAKVPKELFQIPRQGVWKFQFSDPQKYKNGAPCFWEIFCQNPVTSAYLQRLTDDPDSLEVLHEGHLKTAVSYLKNFEKIHKEATSWPMKICENLRNGKEEITSESIYIKAKKMWHSPTNLVMLTFPLIQLKLRLKQVWKQLFFTDYWNIGIADVPIHEFLNPNIKPSVHWFSGQSKSRFLADPFGVNYNEQLHIIYEDLKFDEGRGKIASFLFDDGKFTENEIVIDEAFHMSYPFLFEREGHIYCIPETYQANQVRLYKAVEFPKQWSFEKVLIENYAGIDNTLFEIEGIWYLFSTDKHSGPHYNLNIHYASEVLGPYTAHPKNPVKTDIRSVRPAGNLFKHKGALFRPAMDYSEITINKITEISRLNFKEESYQLIQPFENSYFSDKVHTLSSIGSYTLVDGAKELFILSNFKAFTYKMKRLLNKVKDK